MARLTTEEFIERARKLHGDEYDYSKVKYVNIETEVCIICNKHGEFWQTPNNHLRGQGCPNCIKYNLENCIEKLLNSICVSFEKQKTFEWLKNKRKLRLDFYLPKYNIAIECQGIQHFNDIPYFGGKNKLEYVKNNDKLKNTLCNKYNIHLLYFNYNDDIKEFETKLKKICGL